MKMTAKYGLPYFQNFVNSDLNPQDIRAMCCRLRLDLNELRKNITGGLFGSSESTGSIGVVTINMPRIGYLAINERSFFSQLERVMELASISLETKRKVVSKNIEVGLFPYTRRYLPHLNNHFSTIGLVGMNEACLNFMGKDIGTKEGQKFALKVLDFMLEKLREFQRETGNIYNLEATPAEGASYRLAKIDKQKFPDIITQGKNVVYYTNSTQLPVGYTDDIFLAFKLQEPLQTKYTGGTVLHAFVGEEITSPEACGLLVKRLAENFKIPYFTITPTFSICKVDGYLNGKQSICPYCKSETEVYSRVVGYYRPVANWNEGKQEEFKQRKVYAIK
jgi:ribonucleoside-triphosphate reductase